MRVFENLTPRLCRLWHETVNAEKVADAAISVIDRKSFVSANGARRDELHARG